MRKFCFCILLLFCCISSGFAQIPLKTVWKIGEKDQSVRGMALAPDQYKRFLEADFGYEDRYFLIGKSNPGTEWPYAFPGPANEWGGTGHTAGIRSHFLQIFFELAGVSGKEKPFFLIDLLQTDPENAPLVKVSINGKPWTQRLKKGTGDKTPSGPFSPASAQQIKIELPAGLLKNGFNEIQLTTLEGGWVMFDQLSLKSSGQLKVLKPRDALVKSVKAADYENHIDGKKYQAMLLDLENLNGHPQLSVLLDGREILSQQLDSGRSVLEVPMPAVSSARQSSYTVLVNGNIYKTGKITREAKPAATAADYVNTMLGAAHSRWMIAPGPWAPFGMVKLSPDNQNSGWQAGYDPTFESVGTFSHIHEWTMTGLGTFPVIGQLKTRIGDQSGKDGGYRSRINKLTETAPLGYYSVELTDYNITAELTATTRASFQRYTYLKGETGRVMIDLKIPTEYDYKLNGISIRKVNDYRLEGYSEQLSTNVWSGGVDQEYIVFFVMEFDQPIKSYGNWKNDKVTPGQSLKADRADNAGFYVEFDLKKNRRVQLRTGISYVSTANAALNLKEEIEKPYGWSFEKVRQGQKDQWNSLLGRLDIQSDNFLEKQRFYTNMYRSLASRNTFSDVDGSWRSADESIRKFADPNDRALGCDAFWNTFWNLNQFWNLVTPEWSSMWVKSQLAMYDADGWLAKGPAGMEYIPVMVAEHEIPLIVGAYQMGIRDYDVEKAFQAVHKMQTTLPTKVGGGFAGNADLETYLKHQYVPYDQGRFSNSLEYSYDDWTVGQFAKALGKKEEYAIFNDRGSWWKNAIDKETGYARMRDSKGNWLQDFDPFKSGANKHYVEGNAWQLSFFVPQDVPALARYIGEDNFIKRLEWGFAESDKWRFNGPNDQYWDYPVVQGNQQSMHFAYLFNWIGKPWLTQKWSRAISKRYYGHGVSNAYLGDEDQGQMSAWFVMNALGLFQTDGGTRVDPIYEIGSPLFEKVVIDLGGRYGRGKQFIIEAKNTSKRNTYVQKATLNGKPLNTFHFKSSELLNGGSLVLEMGPEANKNWGIK